MITWISLALALLPLLWFCCCGPTPCVNCNAGTTPTGVTLVIAGIVNGTCTNCTSLNGSHVLPAGPYPCTFTATMATVNCGGTYPSSILDAGFGYPLGGEVSASIKTGAGAEVVRWANAVAMPCDCSTTRILALSLNIDGYCQYGAATCSLVPA